MYRNCFNYILRYSRTLFSGTDNCRVLLLSNPCTRQLSEQNCRYVEHLIRPFMILSVHRTVRCKFLICQCKRRIIFNTEHLLFFWITTMLRFSATCKCCKFIQEEIDQQETIRIPVPDRVFPGVGKESAKVVLEEANSKFQEIFNQSFAELICKVPGSNLIKKPSSAEKKKELRAVQKKVDSNILQYIIKNSLD